MNFIQQGETVLKVAGQTVQPVVDAPQSLKLLVLKSWKNLQIKKRPHGPQDSLELKPQGRDLRALREVARERLLRYMQLDQDHPAVVENKDHHQTVIHLPTKCEKQSREIQLSCISKSQPRNLGGKDLILEEVPGLDKIIIKKAGDVLGLKKLKVRDQGVGLKVE